MKYSFSVLFVCLIQASSCYSGTLSEYIDFNNVGREVVTARLPPLKTEKNNPVFLASSNTQVFQRAVSVGVNFDSAIKLSQTAENYFASYTYSFEQKKNDRVEVVFSGKKLSELTAVIKDNARVRVVSNEISVDQPILVNGKNIEIDFGDAVIIPSKEWLKIVGSGKSHAVIEIKDSEYIVINRGIFKQVEPLLIANSKMTAINSVNVFDSPGYGVIIGVSNQKVMVKQSSFRKSKAAGVAVLHQNENILIQDNTIDGGIGHSNQHAGILVTDRKKFVQIGGPDFLLAPRELPNGQIVYHGVADEPIPTKNTPPKNIFILDNTIKNGLSSGIYLDGAIGTYVKGNYIAGNSKEGMCVDNGAAGNVIADNRIVDNGWRWGKSDLDLELDFVGGFGRMSDGTANAKLPGISVDNAIFNIIMDNHISDNAGSGIKMVRTAFYNVFGHNIISNINAGKNDRFFFFGVEVGGAVADSPVTDLDFKPSMGNIIFQNMITGPHYAGIQFCEQCSYNDVFDNFIFNSTNWAIEQTSPSTTNVFSNNFSLQKSRNVFLNGGYGSVLIGGENIRDN